jgi:hypothetical protein
MTAAIADGVAAARGEPTESAVEEGTAAAEATSEATGEQQEATGTESTETEGTAAAADEATEEVPTEYFGQDLSEFEPDVRKAIIEMVAPRDRHIQQLMREKASAPEPAAEAAPPEPPAPAEDTEVTLEEVAKTFGYDLDDPTQADVAKAMVPATQLIVSLKQEVDQLKTSDSVRAAEVYWTQGLSGLESQFGQLPEGVTHDEVIRIAAENGIAEPVDAYWRIMGPARQAVMDEVRARREAVTTTLKKTSTQAKPKSTTDTVPTGPTASNVKDATAQVFEQLKREGKWSPQGVED